MSAPAVLHVTRHPGLATAADTLAWFAAHTARVPAAGDVIGYLLAPGDAQWFRHTGGVARGPDGHRDLAGAFELFATCGATQLRWLHQDGGQGTGVCLSEDTGALPPGEPVTRPGGHAGRQRLDGTAARVLAGEVTSSPAAGWARLVTARYAPCDVPVTARPRQQVWALLTEYTVQDTHGNLSVADTLLVSLIARDSPASASEGRHA